MRKNIRRMGKAITVVNICVILLCVMMTLLLLIPSVYQLIAKEDQPIFGHYLYVNTNNSLEPVMQENDIIAVEPEGLEQMAVGDFLCYYPIGEQENGVQFGKIVAVDGDILSLSDKLGHSVELTIGEIVPVGRATYKIVFLGQFVHFLKDSGNRLFFYLTLIAVVAALLALTIALHIKQRKLNAKRTVPANTPQHYSLEELVQVELEPIRFERAPQKEEEILR